MASMKKSQKPTVTAWSDKSETVSAGVTISATPAVPEVALKLLAGNHRLTREGRYLSLLGCCAVLYAVTGTKASGLKIGPFS